MLCRNLKQSFSGDSSVFGQLQQEFSLLLDSYKGGVSRVVLCFDMVTNKNKIKNLQ